MTSEVVSKRNMLAMPLLAVEFVGVPLVFGGLAASVETANAAEYERSFDLIQVVPALILLAVGALTWYRNRHKPSVWAQKGLLFGGIGGFFVCGLPAALASGLPGWFYESLIYLFPFFGVIGAGLCWALGWAARRVLTFPVVAELGDSPYAWEFPVRDAKRVSLKVDTEKVHIVESYSFGSGENSSTRSRGQAYQLRQVDRVDEVAIDGYGGRVQPLLPPQIEATVGSQPGTAVALQAGQYRWVVPIDAAGEVCGLIQRRMAAAPAARSR